MCLSFECHPIMTKSRLVFAEDLSLRIEHGRDLLLEQAVGRIEVEEDLPRSVVDDVGIEVVDRRPVDIHRSLSTDPAQWKAAPESGGNYYGSLGFNARSTLYCHSDIPA